MRLNGKFSLFDKLYVNRKVSVLASACRYWRGSGSGIEDKPYSLSLTVILARPHVAGGTRSHTELPHMMGLKLQVSCAQMFRTQAN